MKTNKNFVLPFQEIGEKTSEFLTPIFHIDSVKNSEITTKVYEECMPVVSKYDTDISQNENIYLALKDIQSKEKSSLTDIQNKVLENEITRKYCLLVQSHSLRTYSKPIQNIINYISFNLTADLSLNALSEEFMLNSSYLSTLFKKETGVPLTNFVNNKRIEHAIYLLNTTQSAIQDIAAQCGINDVNYFTKLFKKLKNMTPTQYREMIQHK